MTEEHRSSLSNLEEDLQRFRGLHSWYKFDRDDLVSVFPLLNFGQQPYQPISPDTNPAYKNQLRWWFVIDPSLEEYTSVFPKHEAILLWEASYACVSNIKINKLGSSRDDKIMKQLAINATNFYNATRAIYQKLATNREF